MNSRFPFWGVSLLQVELCLCLFIFVKVKMLVPLI